jgi:nucleoside-diphosphate-sugar epimerase
MRIAIFGATSQIAKDLVRSFAAQNNHELILYARRPDAVTQWLISVELTERYVVADFSNFNIVEHFDVILNFVGVGNPAITAKMGASIFDITLKYDELALGYVRQHPSCQYIFLSSGAAYGSTFDAPADAETKAIIDINKLQPQDWYGVAKLYAECRHRALPNLPIIDIRIFNYYSHTQDMEARFFITDMVRALRDNLILNTTSEIIFRDYIQSNDFYNLVKAILESPKKNIALDCYSKEAVDKITLLESMKTCFKLKFNIIENNSLINATGSKKNYYSNNKKAEEFGYIPKNTSLENIINETEKYLALYGDKIGK